MSAFTEEQLSDFKELFGLYDKTGSGQVEIEHLGDLLRSVGQNPTNAELSELKNNSSNGKVLSFDDFLKIVGREKGFEAKGTVADLCQGFQVFDREGNGTITAGELRYVLTSHGEKLSDSEVDDLLHYADVSKDGYVNYEDFVKMVLAQ